MLLLLLACRGPSDTDADTWTDTPPPRVSPFLTGDTGAPPLEPVVITAHDVTCTSYLTNEYLAELRVDATGPFASGHWYMAETASSSMWAENHPLTVDGEALGVELVEQVPSVFESGVNTTFTCEFHHDVGGMTYIARAYRADGTLGDCLAWGQDPVGLLAGDYDDDRIEQALPPDHPEELAGCRVEVAAR